MKRYIALLRGINVGGKNKVSMSELKMLFEAIGFEDVITYINSGNVVFSSDIKGEEKMQKTIKKSLREKFGHIIPVAIISPLKLKEALDSVPTWWDGDEQSKHNAIFAIPPSTAKEVLEQICDIKQEYEKMYCCGDIIFWSAPTKTFSKTRLTRFVSGNPCDNLTIRNANTTKKLLQLV